MVTGNENGVIGNEPARRVAGTALNGRVAVTRDYVAVRIDGARPLSAEVVARVGAACDRVEAADDGHPLVVWGSGAPGGSWAGGLTVGLVSRWERVVRRLERLPVATIGLADGDCGGTALDALLATDYRVVTPTTRFIVVVQAGATWPGMALFRLVNQAASAAPIRRAVLFGAPIEASLAHELHLVDELDDDLAAGLAAVRGLTSSVIGSELAIRRQLMIDASTVSFEEALGVHLAACDRALRQGPAA
jgi:isomerase DpgB